MNRLTKPIKFCAVIALTATAVLIGVTVSALAALTDVLHERCERRQGSPNSSL